MDDFTIRVTPETLMTASASISQKADHMKSTSSEISEMIQRTVGYWAGDAAELHRTLLKEQLPKLEAITTGFVSQADKLEQIAVNYSGASQSVKEMVEELPSDVII